jgi:hypothetical protein
VDELLSRWQANRPAQPSATSAAGDQRPGKPVPWLRRALRKLSRKPPWNA